MTPPVTESHGFTRPLREEGAAPATFGASSYAATEQPDLPEAQAQRLIAQGIRDAEAWQFVDSRKARAAFAKRWRDVKQAIRNATLCLGERQAQGEALSADEVWHLENARLLHTLSREITDDLKSLRGLAIREKGNTLVPRAFAIAVNFLPAAELRVTERALAIYLEGIQQAGSLMMAELWALKPMLEYALLEMIANVAATPRDEGETGPEATAASKDQNVGPLQKAIQALHLVIDMDWQWLFDQTSAVEHLLSQDPSAAYPKMDEKSRQMYLQAVEDMARKSLFSEEEVARQALSLARRAQIRVRTADRTARRRCHVGYYLVAAGSRLLKKRVGYKPSVKQRILDVILEWPEIYYIVGVELTTLALVFFLLQHLGVIIPLIPGLLLLIPASHAAIGAMNHLTGLLVPPRRIPKLDYAQGIPRECTTLVAVPCLLLSEAEVRRNVEALEIRYLGNRDPHLHFALLTDSPDAAQPFDEHDGLVAVCSHLIQQLNQKYAPDQRGSFLHLHRHRVYNPSEGSWMGWERKRGKLMDLNKLLLGVSDSFPVKTGDAGVLADVRYVITLDADTKLPPGTAQRLIGALAHPLNQPVVDRRTNTVVEGYGILQPHVSVSIESARHSRLAAIYAGQTGFDIYTQAISDVYQDLFGEGSFTGKGIYEVETFQRVLGKRFPTNALLSHDLIEGAYARAGLVSDIEVIDDYPSHFSAYSRRLHRWVRGDWQIMRWLLPRVPDYYGRRVPNPLAFISRWKIFDNLRRSMNEIGLFLLLILGWAILPGGPVYWTLVTLALLLMPTYLQFLFAFFRIRRRQDWRGFLRDRADDLVSGHLQFFVMLVFLPHQALIMLDAIIRTLTRLTVTHSKLLEWETAAEAETRGKKTLVESYLAVTPGISLAVGLTLALVRPSALYVASPVLGLWLLADFFTAWINRRPAETNRRLTPERESFLRLAGLRTWRYFREFSNADNHWLIPDNVQQSPPLVASRLSPTNLGLLLNAHLAAHELGYSTLREFAEAVDRTLYSARQLPRYNGHFFNWYDLTTARPLEPLFISTVDSGNLAVCLWTLKQACLGLLNEPLLSQQLWRGIHDHFRLLAEFAQDPAMLVEARKLIRDLAASAEPLGDNAAAWIGALPWLEEQIQQLENVCAGKSTPTNGELGSDWAWWSGESAERLRGVRDLVENLIPWAIADYSPFFRLETPVGGITLASLPAALREVETQVAESLNSDQADETRKSAAHLVQRKLPLCARNGAGLAQALQRIAQDADRLVEEMDFRFLYNPRKKRFSTGYNATAHTLDPTHYDLLASEARTAVLVAAAKGDVNQEAWFHLGRTHTSCLGEHLLLSWSGTMFEYLMPELWMRSHPDTLLHQSLRAAVHCQQKYARRNGVPWGISEAAFSQRDPQGAYHYRAFGAPGLALDPHVPDRTVVSPYSTFLALPVDPVAAIRNLEVMGKMGCLGSRGFYESCDFNPAQQAGQGEFEIVSCWMAHHQGMSLVALSNFLNGNSNQKWFHREPRVRAMELLLHERVARSLPAKPDFPASTVRGRHAQGRKPLLLTARPGCSPGPKALTAD